MRVLDVWSWFDQIHHFGVHNSWITAHLPWAFLNSHQLAEYEYSASRKMIYWEPSPTRRCPRKVNMSDAEMKSQAQKNASGIRFSEWCWEQDPLLIYICRCSLRWQLISVIHGLELSRVKPSLHIQNEKDNIDVDAWESSIMRCHFQKVFKEEKRIGSRLPLRKLHQASTGALVFPSFFSMMETTSNHWFRMVKMEVKHPLFFEYSTSMVELLTLWNSCTNGTMILH